MKWSKLKSEIYNIFDQYKGNDSPPDEVIHKKAEELGIDPDVLEAGIYKAFVELLHNMPGKHNDVPDSKFNPQELEWGIDIEKEHTDNPEIAKHIAKDHLTEIPDYYTRLKKLEKEAGITEGKTGEYLKKNYRAWSDTIQKNAPAFPIESSVAAGLDAAHHVARTHVPAIVDKARHKTGNFFRSLKGENKMSRKIQFNSTELIQDSIKEFIYESRKKEAILKLSSLIEDGEKWSQRITNKATYHPPEGTFEKSGESIASTLLGAANPAKAMRRLMFYKNRAGGNLPPEREAAISRAEKIIHGKTKSGKEEKEE